MVHDYQELEAEKIRKMMLANGGLGKSADQDRLGDLLVEEPSDASPWILPMLVAAVAAITVLVLVSIAALIAMRARRRTNREEY